MERERRLRETMVSQLQRTGVLHAPSVAAAMRAVPRHRFLPALTPEEAYADRAISIKTEGDCVLSSISQPAMIVQMLELLDVRPGERLLEIGTGSGYNAALLAELTGPSGAVVTVELDVELARAARATLSQLGYGTVAVRAGDGAIAPAAGERFDAIVVTARTDDVAPAWWDAMEAGTRRLVLPLRLDAAGEYAVGFALRDGALHSTAAHPCAFIALRGTSQSAPSSEVFYRDPATRGAPVVRRVASIVAVRRSDATAELLERADVVVARPASLFGVTFTS